MKKSLRLVIIAAGAIFLLTAGCATRKKSHCNCPAWGREIHKNAGLQKSS